MDPTPLLAEGHRLYRTSHFTRYVISQRQLKKFKKADPNLKQDLKTSAGPFPSMALQPVPLYFHISLK